MVFLVSPGGVQPPVTDDKMLYSNDPGGNNAPDIPILDTADNFTATNVEDALAELFAGAGSTTHIVEIIKQANANGIEFQNELGNIIANLLLAKWLLGDTTNGNTIPSERLHILGNLLTETPGIDEVGLWVDKNNAVQIVLNTGVDAQNAIRQGIFGVGVTNNDPSAITHFQSTSKGHLGPRGTTTQRLAIANPAEGLEFYDLDLHQKMMYNGSSWVVLG